MAMFPEVGFGKITEVVPASILLPFNKLPERMAVVAKDVALPSEFSGLCRLNEQTSMVTFILVVATVPSVKEVTFKINQKEELLYKNGKLLSEML